MSEGAQRRQVDIDQDRVTVLLLINSSLIKKAYSIYATILSNRQIIQQMLPQNRQNVLEQYNNINRRLQCNLSVLSYINDQYHNKMAAQQPNRLKFPVIVSPPPEMPELRSLYKRLQDLYPEAIEFLKSKIQQMKSQQGSELPGQSPQNVPSNSTSVYRGNHINSDESDQTGLAAKQHLQQHLPLQHNKPIPNPQLQQSNFSQLGISQAQSPSFFPSPQMNVPQHGSGENPEPKLGGAQQQGAQTRDLKSNENFFGNTISPQMVSDDPELSAFGGAPGFMGFKDSGKNAPMSSISPSQILPQQNSNQELSLDFF